jgi:hypothetical protein
MIRVGRFVAVLAAILAATALGANPGAAATPASDIGVQATCPEGFLCLFEHRDFAGQMLALPAGSTANLHQYPCSGCRSSRHSGSNDTWGDMLSSWENKTNVTYAQFYNVEMTYYTGYYFVPRLSVAYVGTGLNDEISALRPVS